MKRHLICISLIVLPLVLTGCLVTTSRDKRGGGQTLSITASTTTLHLGKAEIATLTAVIRENGRDLIVDESQIAWELSDPALARLSSTTGRQVTLTALQPGSVTVRASFGSLRSSPLVIVISENTEIVLFRETFDQVPDGTNLRDDRSGLDQPESFSRDAMSGTILVTGGVMELGSQRLAIEIPGLASAEQPVLRVTIKNDNGSGVPVPNLKLAVGNRYSTSGAVGADGYRAHGEYPITHADFQVLEVVLDTSHTHTELLNFRGIVGTSGTKGLFIDVIEVVDLGSGPGPVPGGPQPPDPPPYTPPPEVIADAYFGLVGWASENGGTTGGEGSNSRVVFIDNGADLVEELYANERRHRGDARYGEPVPLIIYITGTITKENAGVRKIDIKDQADVSIIGYGDAGEFDGIGLKLTRAHNIIIRNLTIHHVRGPEDGIEIDSSTNIWIDRNTIYNDLLLNNVDYYDGLIDIKNGSRYITISWNKLHSNAKGLLVGHTDNDTNPPDKITFHHNHFYMLNTRVPLIRHAQVHFFNNLIEDIVGSGTNVRMGALVRIENNYYDNVGSGTVDPRTGQTEGPIGWWYGSPSTGYWEVIDNVFVNNPVNSYESTTTVAIPYDYSMALNSAERARELVLEYAGAGSPSLQ